MHSTGLLLRLLLIVSMLVDGAGSAAAAARMAFGAMTMPATMDASQADHAASASHDGTPFAAARMHAATKHAVTQRSAQPEPAQMPCHEAATVARTQSRTGVSDVAVSSSDASRRADAGHGIDGCDDDACRCVAAQGALPRPAFVMRAPLSGTAAARALEAGHRAPPLPHLLRPPIA